MPPKRTRAQDTGETSRTENWPPPPPLSTRRRRRRLFAGKIVSGQFDEENPFVQISSVLLVQADEGVSFLIMDRIGDFYRSLPRKADVIVTTVGARHKCQQGSGADPDTQHTAAQIAQLVATTVEQILANRPESHPSPDQQSEEIRKLWEEIARLREERSSAPPPPPAREVPFSAEVLAVELPQHFKFSNVGEYDGMEYQELPGFQQAFLNQFASSKKQPMNTLNLFTMKQKEQESLREYIRGFNRTC
ncbi:hypothetical protein F511_31456 [Dorcoceras hygrometricum]|uniref:Retrotransposon gag domain-containing protein n=1 Tax=Dorcoceras hygrometricum TaxID=472368 RepID=A0A2Z7BN37_9LAMI|nr:hypothetical protein F511_31456 [Dorcoceras hygrometricum]